MPLKSNPPGAPGVPAKQSHFHHIRPVSNTFAGFFGAVSRFRIPQAHPSGSDQMRGVGLTRFDPYATVGVTRSSQFSVSL
jgi:hypothetical protein